MAQPEASGSRRPRPPKRQRVEKPRIDYGYTPWMDSFPAAGKRYTTVEDRLHDEILAFSRYIQPTSQEIVARTKVTGLIKRACQHLFSDAEISTFGSASTGLALPDGDIDLVIKSKSLQTSPTKERPLFRLSSRIKSARLTGDVQVNHRARVPIITFTTFRELGEYSVDIGLNNLDGIAGADVVNTYLESMPALRSLILLVKSFLSQREMNSAATAGLGSYAVICMCISFLQLNPLSFPVEFISSPITSRSLGSIFMGFLTYYGSSFPYTTACISVTQSRLLSKEEVQEAGWVKLDTKNPGRLAIQCLINPDNDVGKSASRIEKIKSAFREGYDSLSKAQLKAVDVSVLGCVIGLSEATVQRRAFIQDIVDSGRLDSKIRNSSTDNGAWSARGGGQKNNNHTRNNHHNYNDNNSRNSYTPRFPPYRQPPTSYYDSYASSSSFAFSPPPSYNYNHNSNTEEGPSTKKQRRMGKQ